MGHLTSMLDLLASPSAARRQTAAIAEHGVLASLGELGIAARLGRRRHTRRLLAGIVLVSRRCRVETSARRSRRRCDRLRHRAAALLGADPRLLGPNAVLAMHAVGAAQLPPVRALLSHVVLLLFLVTAHAG